MFPPIIGASAPPIYIRLSQVYKTLLKKNEFLVALVVSDSEDCPLLLYCVNSEMRPIIQCCSCSGKT